MEVQIRKLRIVHAAMLLAVVVYVFLADYLRQNRRIEMLTPAIFFAITIAAAVVVGATFFLRQIFIDRSSEVLRTQPDDLVAASRWFTGYLVIFAMCEAVVLFGFVLRLIGATLAQVAPFYVVGVILLLLFAPRRP